ncbi:MAG: DEAD/DEAH box helicase, partial [Methanosphaera sp.]|nr:DEAD/DEAH box helicase [Methanosphaera sp.]
SYNVTKQNAENNNIIENASDNKIKDKQEEKEEKDDANANNLVAIKDINDIFYNNNIIINENSNHVFLESIPDLYLQSLSMLTNQDFIDEDLKNFLDDLFKNLDYYINQDVKKHILITRYYNDFIYTPNQKNNQNHTSIFFNYKWGHVDKWTNFSININSNYSISTIDVGAKSNFKKYKSSKLLFGFLVEYNKSEDKPLSKLFNLLDELYLSTLELIKKHAIIPELFKSNDKYHIRWIPALYNPIISNLIDQLAMSSPEFLVTYNRQKINSKNQVITFISIIIDGIIKAYLDTLDKKEKKELLSNPLYALFLGESRKTDVIQNIDSIDNLIAFKNDKRFNYDIFITITQEKEDFKLDIKISFDDEKKVDINEILEKSDDNKLKNQLENDLEIINKIIPYGNKITNNKEDILLTTKEFSDFFNKSMPVLENMGVKIILPKNLRRLWHPKVILNINENSNDNGYLSLQNILDFDWKVAIGDKNLSLQEFKKLAQENKQMVKLADDYVIMDYNDVVNILKQMKSLPKKLDNYDLIKSMATGQLDDIPVNIDKEFKEKFFNNNIIQDDKLPKYINATLRDYQITGYHWLKQNYIMGFGSVLADDMGLGKTLQVLTLIEYLKEEDVLNDAKVLVIAPTGLLINWQIEIEKFTPNLNSHIYHGSDRSIENKKYDILITSYGIIRQDFELLNDIEWDLIVIDEAQNIKNPLTKQTKAVKSLNSKNKIALTGTPIENNLSEYWSIFDFVNYGYLGKLNDFRKSYVNAIENNEDIHSLNNLKTITQPFVLRRLKTDNDIIKDLPDKITNDLYCNLSAKQAVLYEETLNAYMENIEKLDSINRRGKIFELINSLKQICNHPAQLTKSRKIDVNDSGKMQLLLDTLESILDNNEKVLIFTQYVQMGKIIKRVLEDKFDEDVLFLHGSLSRYKRDKLVRKFQSDDNSRIFVLSLKAGGTGLNLTAACNVIHYDLWWNPAVENQATDRAYRIGQDANVMVYRFITTGTFEERINDMLEDKQQLADITIGSGAKFITEMDDDNLRQLLRLRKRLD